MKLDIIGSGIGVGKSTYYSNEVKIRIISDVHLEFGDFTLPIMDGEDDQVLVIAGDTIPLVGYGMVSMQTFLYGLACRFYHVIVIAGNHEFYNGHLGMWKTLHDWDVKPANVHILQNTSVEIDNVLFLGATLWTDCYGANPVYTYKISTYLNDFTCIKNENGKHFTIHDSIQENNISRTFICGALEKNKNKKTVIITHHAPTEESIEAIYKTNLASYGFVNTRLGGMIDEYEPDLWIHGHLHTSFDFQSQYNPACRIVCNPRGYEDIGQVNKKFDKFKVVNV